MNSPVLTIWLARRALGTALILATVCVSLLGYGAPTANSHAPDVAAQVPGQDGFNPHQPVSNHSAGEQIPVTLASAAPSVGERSLSAVRSTQTIYLPDTRTRVLSPASTSWRWNVHLEVYWTAGYTAACTGWLAGPHTVITAGHCLFDQVYGWASQARVIPARNNAGMPFGEQWSTDLRSVDGWTLSGDSRYDYGAVILPDDTLGNAVGVFMPYGYFSDSFLYLMPGTIAIAGYPYDKKVNGFRGQTLWVGRGRRLTLVEESMVRYQVDTEWNQSGAAVWTTYKGTRFAVAIHTQDNCGFYENCGVRINQSVASTIVGWGGAPPLTDVFPGPSVTAPANNLLTNARVTFDWALRPEAAKYEMEIWKWVCTTLDCDWRRTIRKMLLAPPITMDLGTGYYYWAVRSIQPNNIPGEWSEWRWLEVDKRRPGRPIPWWPLKGDTTSDTSPTFYWEMPPGHTDIEYFELQVSSGATFSTPFAVYIAERWYEVPAALTPGRWYWRVRAFDHAGNVGPWSPVWNVVIVTVTGEAASKANPAPAPMLTPAPVEVPVVQPVPADKQIPSEDIIPIGPLPVEPAPVTAPGEPPPVTPPPAPEDPVEPAPVELPPAEPPRDAPPAEPDPGGLPPGEKPPVAQQFR